MVDPIPELGAPKPVSPPLFPVLLSAQSVNEVLESVESPLELVEGFVGSIEVAVPWAALLTDHCTVQVSGLQLTLQPRRTSPGEGRARGAGMGWVNQPPDPPTPVTILRFPPCHAVPGAADWQSTTASRMTTSMQLAQECLRDGPPEPSEPPQPLEGLEMFAQTIETGVCPQCPTAPQLGAQTAS